jgi:hypothetical protein
MLGQSVNIDGAILMIHGGAGWSSRAAVRILPCTAVRDPRGVADGDVMPHFFRHIVDINHFGFGGSPLDDDVAGIKGCPSVCHEDMQRRLVSPLEQVVFWHSERNDMLTVTDGYRIVFGHVDGMTMCNMLQSSVPHGTRCLQTEAMLPLEE